MLARKRIWLEVLVALGLVALGLWLRVALTDHWGFGGSDSYGYLNIADEWRVHGRFSFGALPMPLEWYRRPLYPMILSLVKGDAVAAMSGGPGWKKIELFQILFEAAVLWPLLYFTARAIAGASAALVALALAVMYVPSMLAAGAILTESVAMTFAALAVAPLLWRRRTLGFALAALGAALSALLRPDGLLWVVALVPALLARGLSRTEQRRLGALYVAVFLVVFAPWPIRNLVAFHEPHLGDGMIDRVGNDVPYYKGFWHWMRTWADSEQAAGHPVSCFYDTKCRADTSLYNRLDAFDAPATTADDERAIVGKVLAERATAGITQDGAKTFDDLANARTRAHPFRVLVELPLRRALRMWVAPQSELVANTGAWPSLVKGAVPALPAITIALFVATFVAAVLLFFFTATRALALVVFTPLVLRSLALGWLGFSLPRYTMPCVAVCFLAIGIAAGTLIEQRRLRRA